ncbi:MAG: hypothetical protein CMM46_00315 [Rhodospirillaceae bacterium]|nr:hypothetical protein [Rhodospirillaceae bacterium]|tara:strand:+ start:2106 stop:2348 length:243 start_codon:yes stop_codon:yes gene_type:complete
MTRYLLTRIGVLGFNDRRFRTAFGNQTGSHDACQSAVVDDQKDLCHSPSCTTEVYLRAHVPEREPPDPNEDYMIRALRTM